MNPNSPLGYGYWPADYIYVLMLLVVVLCLYRGHRGKHINLWECVTSTDKKGITRTDSRKLWEAGAFVVMTIGFAYLVVQDKLTEFYALIYVGAWVTARTMRDREQRLTKMMEMAPKPKAKP